MVELARRFAALLDRNDFEGAARLLAPGCRYFFREELIEGRDKIVAEYARNYEAGAAKFDEIVFSSEVLESDDGSFKVRYLDRLRKGSRRHEHRCEQVLRFEGGLIVEIRHVDLPGEAEALQRFRSEDGGEAAAARVSQ